MPYKFKRGSRATWFAPLGVVKRRATAIRGRVCLLGWLMLSALAGLAYAVDPPEAIGSLYSQDPQKYLCTASVVAGFELGLDDEVAVLTAAHCVEAGLVKAAGAPEWTTDESFTVSFDSEHFFAVYPYRVGFAQAGYDLAVLRFVDDTPAVAPLHMGSWDRLDFGSDIQNYANPLGMGIQYFTGAITMMHISPSPMNKKPQWHHNAVASVQVGPGSSGSLILNENQEYVGVLSGVMEARFGSPFTIFVPQWRFEDFLLDDQAGRSLACSACSRYRLALREKLDGDVMLE